MNSLQKNIKFYSITLVVTYLLVAGINYYFNRDLATDAIVKMMLSVFMITTSIYVSNAFVMFLFFKKVNIENENYKYALGYWIQILTALIVSIVIDVIQKIWIYDVALADALNRIYSLQMIPQYFLVFCISTLVYFFLIYKSKQENKVREHKIVAQSASAKFETLKSQIDPHFLFNSLNVLSSLIEENPEKAQQFTIALSKTYRYVLEQRNKDLVDLKDELAFAKTFEKLLKLRFEDSLEIILPSETINPDAKVIPLVLQLLLENAVKHNIINSNQKLIIQIEIKDKVLVVSNNIQPKNVLNNESTGFGLQHIIEQYDLVTDNEVLIKQTKNRFEVYLPILTEQVITEVNMDLEYQTDEIIYKKAKARLKELKEFYSSIGTFFILCIVYIALHFLNINHPMLTWMPIAIAVYVFILLIQAIKIFGLRNWEQNMISKIMNQNKDKYYGK